MESLEANGLKISWLRGGIINLDGGAMFGVVPKALWSRKYPVNELNQIETTTDPMLIQKDGYKILIDAGIGVGRFTEKQKRNYGVTMESMVDEDLATLGLRPSDIDIVLMTHFHFDHATGLVKERNGKAVPTFENAAIIVSEVEWNEVRVPTVRSKNTYWENNWKPISKQIKTFKDKIEVIPGLTLTRTGGHSNGHSILLLEHESETYIHFADIMPTHVHNNSLWVMAYDDYPMESIAAKQKWKQIAEKENAWYLFYHDYKYRAVKWDEEGKIKESILRETSAY